MAAKAKAKGESKSATVGMLAAVPMPEPRSTMRRRMRAAGRPLDCLTAAKRAIDDANRKRAKEHELTYVIPKRAAAKTQIERLFDEGTIDEHQKRAAERLLRDFSTSGFEPGVVASYEGVGVGGAGMIGTGPTAREYMDAMRSVGVILSPVLVAVVFFEMSPSGWARANNRNRNDGVPLLRAALDALAVHFGFKRAPVRALST